MNPSHLLLAVPLVAALTFAAACGSDDAGSGAVPDGTELPSPDDAVTNPPATDVPATDAPGADDGAGDAPQGDLIGSSNIGGPVIDPQLHPIDSIAIAESYPEQLMITFTAGDPNCTAADARAIGRDTDVVVELLVGITEDAMSKSCVAGDDFEQTISIALTEGLDGRDVVAAG